MSGPDPSAELMRLAKLLAEAHGVDWSRMPAVAQAGYTAVVRDALIESGFLEPDADAE